jgi:voltage-gated potassium channel
MLFAQIRTFSVWLAAILVFGTAGYSILEGWRPADGFYMSVITLATVGYGETQELSDGGRLFTCGLIFVSIISLSCWTACLTGSFVDRDTIRTWHKRKARKMAKTMKKHTIVCGAGAMAQTITKMLVGAKEKVIIIDNDLEALERIRVRYPDVVTLPDSAVDELALASANVLDARCVIASLDSDYDNLLIAMTCKDLDNDIKVIARSEDMDVASRMAKIGVDSVICPHFISGQQAAKLAMW